MCRICFLSTTKKERWTVLAGRGCCLQTVQATPPVPAMSSQGHWITGTGDSRLATDTYILYQSARSPVGVSLCSTNACDQPSGGGGTILWLHAPTIKADARQTQGKGEATNGHERQARQAKTSENGKPSACATPLRVSAKMLCTCIYLHVGTPLYLRKAHTPHSTASQRPQTTQTT